MLPAVVQIAVRVVESGGGVGLTEQLVPRGSGTVIAPQGLVLTSAHVLDTSDLLASAEASQAAYQQQGIDRTVRVIADEYVLLFPLLPDEAPIPLYTATVEQIDDDLLDLAVLRITGGPRNQPVNTPELPFVPLGDSDLVRRGHEIIVVGYPGIARTAIIDSGEVNGFETTPGISGRAWIITDATVSGGSSGGAAVDRAGRLIGVITLASELDCRPGDTNGDGVVDDSDVGCVPVGSALARLRPINLAMPLLEDAGLTPPAEEITATTQPSTPPPPTETPISPTQTPVPLTSTPTLPLTAPVVPTATLEPTATATPTLVPIPVGSRNVPMFRADPSRTGVMAGPGPTSNPKVLWQFATGKPVISSPVVVDGVIYFGSQDGYVYALEASSGEERWRFRTSGDVTGSAAVADGVVYIGSRDSNLYALNAATGEERWRFKTDNAVYSSPVVVASVVYFGSRDGNVYALDVESGAERWRYGTGDEVSSPPAIVGHVLYVGSNVNPSPDQELGGAVFALDAATGEQRWRVDVVSRRDFFSGGDREHCLRR